MLLWCKKSKDFCLSSEQSFVAVDWLTDVDRLVVFPARQPPNLVDDSTWRLAHDHVPLIGRLWNHWHFLSSNFYHQTLFWLAAVDWYNWYLIIPWLVFPSNWNQIHLRPPFSFDFQSMDAIIFKQPVCGVPPMETWYTGVDLGLGQCFT